MKRDIKITVSGLHGVGKTTIATLIYQTLERYFGEEVVTFQDGKDEPLLSTHEYKQRLLALMFSEEETTIAIETQNLNKTAYHNE